MKELKIKKEEYCLKLQNRFQVLAEEESDLQKTYNETVTIIRDNAEETTGTQLRNPVKKISTKTQELIEKRRKMMTKSTTNPIEYREMCKVINKRIRKDIRRFNIERIQMAIENSNSLQLAWRDIMIGKHNLNALNDNVELITDRDSIVEKAAAFYEELYRPSEANKIKTSKCRRYPSNTTTRSRESS